MIKFACERAVGAAESQLAKKIFDSYVGFRKTAIRWSRVGDQAFQAARLLPFRYG